MQDQCLKQPLKIAVAGAAGRLGQQVVRAVLADSQSSLVGALEHSQHPQLGQDAAAFCGQCSGILITDQLESIFAQAECLIDFSTPQSTLHYLEYTTQQPIKLVIGTTGLDDRHQQALAQASGVTAVLHASNMSLGMHRFMQLLKSTAVLFGADYDVTVIETHHRWKKDAPSGTALKMGAQLEAIRSQITQTQTTQPVAYASVRGGDVVGEHEVRFDASGETLSIRHECRDRSSYAQGALRAAHFLALQDKGCFSFEQVLADCERSLQTPPIRS